MLESDLERDCGISESYTQWKASFNKEQLAADKRLRRQLVAIAAGFVFFIGAGGALGIWVARVHDRNARAADAQSLISCRAAGFSEPQCAFMVSNNRRLADYADTASLAAVSTGLAAVAVTTAGR